MTLLASKLSLTRLSGSSFLKKESIEATDRALKLKGVLTKTCECVHHAMGHIRRELSSWVYDCTVLCQPLGTLIDWYFKVCIILRQSQQCTLPTASRHWPCRLVAIALESEHQKNTKKDKVHELCQKWSCMGISSRQDASIVFGRRNAKEPNTESCPCSNIKLPSKKEEEKKSLTATKAERHTKT